MGHRRYAFILGNLGNTRDRFVSGGYKEQPSVEEQWRQAGGMEAVTGVELVGTWDIDEKSWKAVKATLARHRLQCASVIPDTFSQKVWGKGSYSSAEPSVRDRAVRYTKEMIDIAAEIGCDLVSLWPGQDGYDYPLAADYIEERAWLLEGITACARHAASRGVRLALEYKVKEPRVHSYIARASDALLLAQQAGANVGVTIDTGHAFVAQENVGEVIALLSMAGGRLYHMHFNDNYGHWDDDMVVGSVHLVEYFEILYWLERTGYAGWYSMDQYPYREDGAGAVQASISFLRRLHAILDRVGRQTVDELIARRDPVLTAAFVRESLLA